MPFDPTTATEDEDKQGFDPTSAQLDEPAPAPKLASGPRQPMGRGFSQPQKLGDGEFRGESGTVYKKSNTSTSGDDVLDRPAGFVETPEARRSRLEWESLSPQGQQKYLDQVTAEDKRRRAMSVGASAGRQSAADKVGQAVRGAEVFKGMGKTGDALATVAETGTDLGLAYAAKLPVQASELAFKVADFATLGSALTDDRGESVFRRAAALASDINEGVTSQQSTRMRGQQANISKASGIIENIEAIVTNPLAVADVGVSSAGSMYLTKPLALAAGRLATGMALARGVRNEQQLAKIYGDAAERGAIIGNAGMNAGATYSETDGDVGQKLLAAAVSGLGTLGVGKAFDGGAEAALVTGRTGAKTAVGGALKVGGKEFGEEFGESVADQVGQAVATGQQLDADKIAGKALVEGTAGFGTGAAVGARAPQAAPATPSSMDIAKSKGFLAPPPATKAVFTSATTERAGLTPIVVDVPQGPPAVPNAQQPGQTAAQGDQTQPVAPTPQPTTDAPTAAYVDAAANLAATSPKNDLPQPTPEQLESGDYVKGPVQLHGMQINVENPAGSTRSGVDETGRPWSTTMNHHYGEVEGTKGADGDKVDAFIGKNPESKTVWVIDQINPKTGEFDEHKAMIGFTSEDEARKAYLSNYEAGWQGLGAITAMPVDAFRSWSKDGAKKGPIGELQQPAATPAVAGAQSAVDRLAAAQDAGIQAATGAKDGSRVQRAVEQSQPLPAAPAADGAAQVPAGAVQSAEQAAAQAAPKIEPPAPLTTQETASVTRRIQDARLRQGEAVRLEPVSPSTSEDADLASRVSSALGRPVMFVNVIGKSTMNAANVPVGGRQVTVIRAGAEDSMLALSVHEALHGMDDDVKQELHSALFDGPDAPVTAEHVAKFRAAYPMYADDKVAEEIAAMLAQQEAKRPEFWQRLAEKVGDGTFGKLAQAVLQKLDAITAAFKGSNNGTYTRDIKAVREALTSAYAETARRRGAAPVAEQKQGAEAEVDFAERGKAETVGDYEARAFKDGSIRIAGDADAIRAKLPDGVVGRATKDGLVFTATDAPRVRRALEGNNLAYSRAGEVIEKLPMRGGKYVGAPAKFDTPAKIPHLRKWLMKLTLEGERGRFWYENSSREVLRMVGGDVQEARKFVALLAIYSPQAKVDANSTFALRAWAQYKAGQPISVKTKVMDDKAKAALDDVDAFWSGEKTGNFFHNLLREIDPTTEGKQGATIDMWMMRAGQYDNDAPTSTQYAFMENETNRVAAEMGWEPQQVQAAIWVAMKARMENDGVKKATEASSEKRGWIRFDKKIGDDGKAKKVRVILDEQKHRDNWLKHAFEHVPTEADTQKAKFDFSDGLLRHIGQVSFEARPGRTSGVLPGIHDAPYAQQVEFQQAVQKAFLDDQGRDLLAHYLGLLVDNDILAPGVWQGEISPSTQKRVAMAPAKGEDGKSKIDPAQAEALNIYAAVAGLVARQEGVGWHRPFYAGTKSKANGIEIDIGRPLNPREMADLEKAVGKWMADNGKSDWQSQFAFISSPKGIRVVNFGVVTNAELQDNVPRIAGDVLPDGFFDVFSSDGDMPTNNWKESPNGQDYVQRIGAAGRPDVLDWARAVLAPRVQRVFDDFGERYGWGDAGSIDFSERERSAGRSADDGGPDRAERADGGQGSRQTAGQRDSEANRGDGGQRQAARVGSDAATSQAPRRLDPLPGAPTVDPVRAGTRAGPDAGLVAVAESYARQVGIKLTRQSRYAEVDVERARRIAQAYEAMPHAPQDSAVREAYQNLIRQTVAQYRALEQAGYEFWLFDGSSDPYDGDPWRAMADLRENRSMAVYSTTAGFGTDATFDPSENPLLSETGIEWPFGSPTGPRRPVLANDLFRAVHDAFGHGLEGAGFRARGEENAWQAHARLFTGSALGAITSETRGQNSWPNYGPHGETNRNAGLFDTVFADQKTGLMPAWTWEEGRVDFSDQQRDDVSPLGFYSALGRAAAAHPAKALPASAWRDAIKGWANKGLVKADEVEWSGVNDWLAMQDGKVTRDSLTAYLSGNGVQVEETVLGARDKNSESLRIYGRPFSDLTIAESASLRRRLDAEGETAKYGSYTLPGGENYREVLLTLPPQGGAKPTGVVRYDPAGDAKYPWAIIVNGSEVNRSSDEATAPDILAEELERATRRANASANYKSSHWDQKNILAHIRVNDRTDADGKRVLFVEEIQSDWGQEGKKRGFNDPAAKDELRAAEAEVEAARSDLEELAVEGRQATAKRRELREKYDRMLDEAERHPVESRRAEAREAMVELERLRDIEVERARAFSDRNLAAKQRYDAAVEAARTAKAKAAGGIPLAPFVTKTDAWLNLALKRVMAMAVQGGYDSIAFVNGEQSADRYDLSKQIDELVYAKSDDGTMVMLDAFGPGGRELLHRKVSMEDLPDAVGKEVAEKIANGKQHGKLSGLDLKVGGEGMKAFYDKIVPNAVKTLAKKLGGDLWQGEIVLQKGKPTDYEDFATWQKAAEESMTEQSGVTITPAMRDAVGAGLPMFSEQGITRVNEDGENEFGNDRVRLAFPMEAPRFEYFEQPGERVMAYAIMPADGSLEVLGNIELVVKDGKPTTLLEIEVYPNAGQGRNNGVGRAAVMAALSASDGDLKISNIEPKARGFWEKLGIPAQNVEGAYDGVLKKGAGQPGQGGAQGAAAQGRGQARGGSDAGTEAGLPGSVEPDFANQSSTRETDSWILSRDETGRFRFGAGAKIYRAVAGLANKILGRFAMAPASKELTRYIRQMKQEIAKAQELTVDVANQMSKMSEAERLMISDVIEKELAARIRPPAEVLKLASSISAIMGKQTDELVRLGMLSQEAADAWRDRYLPRFYESKLTAGKVKDAWESAVAALTRQPRAIKGINGSSLKRRGMVKTIMAADLADWEAEGWKLDDKNFDPATDIYTQVHRDFTRDEREKMGEIRDAMFRFVMGYMRSQKDIALGRMYEKIAADMAHKVPLDDGREWVKVPETLVEDTKARVYGKLAGKFVPKEVLDHLSQYAAFEDPMLDAMFQIYKRGLSAWKEGKTVLNPVSHVNNIVSNLTMAHFAGVSYWDAHKYIGTTRDIVKKAPMLQEAKDAGLFGGTFNDAELLNSMPEQLRMLAEMQENKGILFAGKVWNALAFWLRKPLGAAYEGEDLFFRYMLYRDARGRGLNPDDAVDWATKFIFTYDDLPKGARIIRDFGIPFFSYTFKAVPALAQTALEHPMRFAAPAALIYGTNLMAYALASGGDDDDWLDVTKRLFTDDAFRAKVSEQEKLERANLPKWNRGRTAMGTQKTIRLGTDETAGLPVFLDVSRFIPGGDMLDMENNSGGIDWLPQPLTPSNPVLTTIVAMLYNKDTFLGKDIVDNNDTTGEAARKRGDWLWKQFAPAISVNGYHWTRAMNAAAQASGTTIPWWPQDATGFGKDGLPTQPKYAAMQTFGVKARPVDLDMSEQIEKGQREKMIRELDLEVKRIRRLRNNNAISDEQADEQIELQQTKKERLREGLDVNGKPKD